MRDCGTGACVGMCMLCYSGVRYTSRACYMLSSHVQALAVSDHYPVQFELQGKHIIVL